MNRVMHDETIAHMAILPFTNKVVLKKKHALVVQSIVVNDEDK